MPHRVVQYAVILLPSLLQSSIMCSRQSHWIFPEVRSAVTAVQRSVYDAALESVTMRCGSSVVTSRYWHFYCQLGVQFVFLTQTNCLPAAGWTEKIQLTCCRRRRRLAGHVYAFIAYDVIRRGSYVIHPWTAASVAVRRHAADGDRQSTQYSDRDWFWKQSKKLGNRPHLVIPLSGIAC